MSVVCVVVRVWWCGCDGVGVVELVLWRRHSGVV